MKEWGTFHRLLILVMLLLIPNIYLYNYANKVSERVITEQLQNAQLNQLVFLSKQIEVNLEQLSQYAISLFNDPSVQLLINMSPTHNYYNMVEIRKLVEQKMKLQTAISGWTSHILLYLPKFNVVVVSDDKVQVQENWHSNTSPIGGKWYHFQTADQAYWFARDFIEPVYAAYKLEAVSGILQVRFPFKYLENIVEVSSAKEQNDPFLLQLDKGLLIPNRSQNEMKSELAENLRSHLLHDNNQSGSGSIVLSVGSERYLLSYVFVKSLQLYLIDYKPLEVVFAPIVKNKMVFYVSIAALLIFAIVSLFYIYQNIQKPIAKLLAGVQSMKRGDYSVRVKNTRRNEFMFLFERFNQMAQEIENLINSVFEERIRSRDAKVKQLQSQINPHFLYNCLAFIKSMARLNRNEKIIEMCLHLGSYYRYATRNEQQMVSLEDELELIRNYIRIQDLKHQRIELEMHVPEGMMSLLIPRLLLQPIVENCIVHGIEQIDRIGRIVLTGIECEDRYLIRIEDNGPGMSEEKRESLTSTLSEPAVEELGCGIRNVHQRLYFTYGKRSGLRIHSSSLGGLSITLEWMKQSDDDRQVPG